MFNSVLKSLKIGQTISANQYSPLTLAYIGDCVFELYIRTYIIKDADTQVDKLHKKATGYVKAQAQANIFREIEPELTDEEIAVYKRGRNAKSHTPKNANMMEYKVATVFYDRLKKICAKKGLKITPTVVECGGANGSVRGWKNGAWPNSKILFELAKRLDVSTDYLLGLRGEDSERDGLHMGWQKIKELSISAANIRKMALEGVYSAGAGHPGGSLSIADILSYLYMQEMNVSADNPKNPDRDRFVLSKGHCAPALYGALAEAGFIPKEDMKNLRSIDSYLQGHPDMKTVPGIDMSTGSLGQGISAASGMALAGKLDKKDYRVYSILGDGEIEEGQVWEAAMFAAHYKLDNLTAFLDFNGLQIDGDIAEVMNPCPIDKKFEAFNWHVITIDAHDFNQIEAAVSEAKVTKGKPTMIIAKSVKGKGVSFMEGQASWHGSAPNKEQYEQAIAELDEQIKVLGGAQ
ncbi:transketolase n-terminal section-related [Holotrichia oblita]|nr:transketolase n-terminal section-related [Holotrichia oblita]